MVVGDLDHLVRRLHVVELVGAHKAAQKHLAGDDAVFRQPHAFRAQHHCALVAVLHGLFGPRHVEGHAAGSNAYQPFPVQADDFGVQEVGLAYEVRHELVGRVVVDLPGSAHLRHHALVHDYDVVGDAHGLGLVVGDVYGGDAELLLYAADLRAHVHPQLGVQVAQGLVKQQHAGLRDQRAGQGDPLLLAAGQLVGETVFHALQAHQLEHVEHPFLDLRLGHLAQL